ncbi:DinB family protein [Flavihumibacter rivuli]|uniref:DinB family protein n=1 Tax=Flavihumibacter rivuli TaxID=2838156 RepID=UPI001BDEA091|nr:DinB family protein [Flavihumibacter rivuli]ULQ57766.1 DinB family protein [Flavihumibacter rivuli]
MLLPILRQLFERDLNRLYKEMESYTHEPSLWVTDKQIANSGGNLCLHLVGNLNTYIGVHLGSSSYVRNRELEFSNKHVPRSQLLDMIIQTKDVVDNTLAGMKEEDLQEDYPIIIWESKTSKGYVLVHLATHLAYHLGQINYHRRLLDA